MDKKVLNQTYIYIEQETLQKDTIDGLGLYDTL